MGGLPGIIITNRTREVIMCDIRSVSDGHCGVITISVVREIAPEVRARKLVSPDVYIVDNLSRRKYNIGVCVFCSTGIRLIYYSDV